MSRYAVGIDLGTTNCALAYVDLTAPEGARGARALDILQWEAAGATIEAPTLPSFIWLAPKAEWKKGQLALPFATWRFPQPAPGGATPQDPPDYAVGRWARQQASLMPGRVVHSAKSWLCHGGVDREARTLPWSSDDVIGAERRAPIEAAAAFLAHLAAVWNHEMAAGGAEARLAAQDVTITVPASFDEAAQRLTLEAAELAGFSRARLRLLEEPQAAFYHWLARRGSEAEAIAAGETVLVCDVGGGTTDFSLFEGDAKGGVERVAVSQHLLLGGDNLDLAVAHLLEPRLAGAGKKLSSRQWAQLGAAARGLKEKALTEVETGSAESPEYHVAVASEGSGLFAGTLSAKVGAQEIVALITSGFFPDCARDARPAERRAGLSDLGLPYAADAAVSRQLAGFLAGRAVDAVLFAGGTMKPRFLRERIVSLLTEWQGRAPRILEHGDLDLAVALGAAHAGGLRAAKAQALAPVAASPRPASPDARLISGGYPRSLYVAVATPGDLSAHRLVCIVPQGLESGDPVAVATIGPEAAKLKVRLGRPVRFQLYSSTRRLGDRPGALLVLEADAFHPLPPLTTMLADAGGQETLVEARLEASLTETGLLDLHLATESQRWQLSFDVRHATHAPTATTTSTTAGTPAVSEEKLKASVARIEAAFGKKKPDPAAKENPKALVKELEELLDQPRERWDGAFLRSLWPAIEPGLTRRGRSVAHEASWLSLAGYALRPGYGFDLDEWRVSELWRAYQMGMSFPKERQVEDQWWIMWRRVAGGLGRAEQEKIYDKIFPALRQGETASSELYMLAASLERVDMGRRVRLGNQLAQQLAAGRKQYFDQRAWALARIASRVPLYGGAEAIVRPKFVEEWFTMLRPLSMKDASFAKLAMFYAQAARLLGDRELDLPDALRAEAQDRLRLLKAPEDLIRATKERVEVDLDTKARLFGESLPSGLVLA